MHTKTVDQQNVNTRKKVQQTVLWTDYPSWAAQKTKIIQYVLRNCVQCGRRNGRHHQALDSSHVSYGFHSILQYNGLWCCGVQLSLFTYCLCCRHRQHDKHMESVELKALKMVQKCQNTYAYNKDSMQTKAVDTTPPHQQAMHYVQH